MGLENLKSIRRSKRLYLNHTIHTNMFFLLSISGMYGHFLYPISDNDAGGLLKPVRYAKLKGLDFWRITLRTPTMTKHPESEHLSMGPFEVNSALALVEDSYEPLVRHLDCTNYCACLNLAVALDWESFTCEGCSGDINESLKWRARQSARRDDITRALCPKPDLRTVKGSRSE